MLVRSLPVLLLSVGLFACGASAEEGKGAANPWSSFTGRYSTPAPRDKAQAGAQKDHAADATEEVEAETTASKKASNATIDGESISSISVDALTDASKTTLKQKFVSNGVVTGPEYEMVQVELKDATVKIVRPAEKPSPNGPAISPKAKSAELSKNEVSWYDEDADVLVVVSAAKKAAAQKALGAIVKR